MRIQILLLGLLLMLASCSSEMLTISDVATYEQKTINYSDSSSIVAVVNGEELTVADVRSSAIRYGVSPTESVFDDLLEGLIIARLTTQDVDVDESDLEERIDDIAGNLSREELEAVLSAQDLSIGLIRERIREEIAMSERFSTGDSVPSGLLVSEYYADNAARFVTPERIVFRHFFVENSSATPEEQQRLIQGYLDTNATTRCAYIAQYSDDASSADERLCGILVISRGDTIPELEYGVYGTPPGVSRLLPSRFGTHVVTVEQIVPAQTLNLSEATPYIQDILRAQEREKLAQREVSGLLRDAQITVYYSR